MNKEAQPRRFEDTQRAYRQGVEDLMSEQNLIEKDGTVFIKTDSRAESKVPIALPIDGQNKVPRNLRWHNMTQIYLFGEETLRETGDYFRVIRQNVQHAMGPNIRKVLEMAPQEGYDFYSLNFRKPPSDSLKDKISQSHGGITVRIRKAIADGATIKDLRPRGFTARQIRSARRILANRQEKVIIPPLKRSWAETMVLLENPLTEREVVRELISEIEDVSTYREYSRDRGNWPAILVNLTKICRMGGLSPRSKSKDVAFVAGWLDSMRVPIGRAENKLKGGKQKGIQRYHFITVNFVDEAVRLLESARGERFDEMRKPPLRRKNVL